MTTEETDIKREHPKFISPITDFGFKVIYNLTNMPEMKTQLAFTNEIPLFMRLEEIASYSQLSPQQQIQYDDSFNNYLAVLGNEAYNKRVGFEQGIEQGRAEGRAEGLSEGLAKGAKVASVSIARSLKAMHIPADAIAKATGLTIDEINEL